MAFYKLDNQTLILNVRACPGAKREGIEDIWNNTHLKIALKARAVDGKANDALIDFLAQTFKVKKNDIALLAGQTARLKRIQIQNIDTQQVLKILSEFEKDCNQI